MPVPRDDYVVIPRGTTHRCGARGRAEQLWLCFHTPGEIETPNRYRNRYGQLLEHAPFSQRDFHPPAELETIDEAASTSVIVRVRGGYQRYVLDYHPFDVVGWDGYVYPYTFNIHDFEPKAGRLHQPPPAHQTFQGPNFVICSFCPRMLDWDPRGDRRCPTTTRTSSPRRSSTTWTGSSASRKGVDVGAITLHPSGLPHGPQPGLVERSLGVDAHRRARGDVGHVPPAAALAPGADARRPGLRLLLARGPGARAAGILHRVTVTGYAALAAGGAAPRVCARTGDADIDLVAALEAGALDVGDELAAALRAPVLNALMALGAPGRIELGEAIAAVGGAEEFASG